ncbi:hypothetical protein Hokovirus_3_92 [Hokovirus HKV1]|uniref:DUF7275 domain-containing protein n=1 Tax=Hokovirus HKV1 TaxID=1977638 RepID=A0A1V0SGH1_9VIRU|nr:hypothetical protein Hokovirus_3_92 [Hokovirus HKV1]
MSKLPVLIGSFAEKPEGIISGSNVNEFKDIDIITDVCIKNKIQDKYKHLLIDQTIVEPGTSFKLIFDYCNDNINEQKVITILDSIKIIVCPRYLLYAIKKSHIHRIIPYFKNTFKNIEIWHKNVKQYLNLRSKINYKEFDRIIYESQKNKIEKIMYDVFNLEFITINNSIGDTNVSMDDNKENFFNDNVERFYDHDKLHVLVAKKNRSTTEPIYLKYSIPNSVNLDKELFMQDTLQNHINMFREEIIVLLLERKLLPTIMNHFVKLNKYYNGYEKKQFKKDILEIVANYATNLCGNGWLRNYVIDHLDFLMNYNLSMLEEIIQVILRELNIVLPMNTIPMDTIKFIKCDKKTFDVFELVSKHNVRFATDEMVEENKIYFENKNTNYYLPITNISNQQIKKLVSSLINDFNNNSKYTFCFAIKQYYYVYNTEIGCGLCYKKKTDTWIQFVIDYGFNNKVSVDTSCQYIKFNNTKCYKLITKIDDYRKNYIKYKDSLKCKHGTFYYSRGQYCGEIQDYISEHDSDEYCYNYNDDYVSVEKTRRLLLRYGNLPKFLHILTEHVARLYLDS